jgi:amidohydrolase
MTAPHAATTSPADPTTPTLYDAARALRPWLTDLRRALHRDPELSGQERRTSRRCAEVLAALPGWHVRPDVSGFGLLADLTPPHLPTDAPRVALRADMDALPIQEASGLPYQSQNPGVAHMCGHDAHMTIALGAARLLSDRLDALPCHVRLIFQPSEELPPGGALSMIAAGALDGVGEVYGLHNIPELDVGQVATRPGPLTAAADIFVIDVLGRGGHAARPHETLDPIPTACALVTQLQTLVARRCAPDTAAVVSVTRITAGTTHNIIPDACTLEGTVRTFDAATRDALQRALTHMAESVAAAHGLRAEVRYTRGYDSVTNHPSGVARVLAATRDALPPDSPPARADEPARSWGEDFCYYLQHRPGAFFLLGSGTPGHAPREPLHSPRFQIDESCLPIGAAVMAALCLQR